MTGIRKDLVEATVADAADAKGDAKAAASDRSAHSEPGHPDAGPSATIIRFPEAW